MSTEKPATSGQQPPTPSHAVPQSTSLFRAMNFELFVKPVCFCRLQVTCLKHYLSEWYGILGYQDFSLPSIFAPRSESSQWEPSLPGTKVPGNILFLVVSSLSDHGKGCLQYADAAILVKNHRIFPLPLCFCSLPQRRCSLGSGYQCWRSKMQMMGQSGRK